MTELYFNFSIQDVSFLSKNQRNGKKLLLIMKSSFRLSREYEVESALWNQAQAIEIISYLGHWFPFATQIGKRLRTFGKWKSMSNYQTKLLSAHY